MRFLLLLYLCLWFVSPALAQTSARPDTWEGTVLSVRDGDSVVLSRPGKNGKKRTVTVRLYGVDAPEQGQNFGREAYQWLRDRLPAGTQVQVIPYDRDKHRRVVGVILHSDENIHKSVQESAPENVNATMVAEGLAWVYRRYCKQSFCAEWNRAEQQAKTEGRGLWREPHPQRPELWRRQHPRR